MRGQHIEDYIVEAQDNVRSAHRKSLEAAFLVWQQQLGNDQAKFEAAKLMRLGLTRKWFEDVRNQNPFLYKTFITF